jgi:hypothetical protein
VGSDELDRLCQERGFRANAIKEGRRLAGVKSDRVGFGPEARYMVSIPEKPRDDDSQGDPDAL